MRVLAPVLIGLLGVSCDLQPDPDQTPTALPIGRFADVRILYRQPNGCANAAERCDDLVVFFGSWMKPGEEVILTETAGARQWTGIARRVPVNWPPVEEPHLVRVFDPHLVDSPTSGVTAARLSLGGQFVEHFDTPGTPTESGVVYVDDNGIGRNPQ